MAVPVVVFSDFTSPFCHVTEAALRLLEDEGLAEVRYLAWELHPAPAPLPEGPSASELGAAAALAEELGLELAPPARVPRTAKAHEAVQLAGRQGLQRAMRAALFHAYFGAGRDIGRIDVLVEVAAGLGLDPTEARVVLDVDTYSAEVAAERALGERLGITAVPALVVGEGPRAELLLGARPLEELRERIEAAAAA
jgi:predicted DsbA family dithiol-disulfide isomerase